MSSEHQVVPHYTSEQNIDASSIWSYATGRKHKLDPEDHLTPYFNPDMPFRKRLRIGFRRSGFTPRRTGFRQIKRVIGRKRPGYVKRYKRKAFMGRPFSGQVAARAIETRKLLKYTGSESLLNVRATQWNNYYAWAPMLSLIAGPLPNNFVGTQIWLRGIKLKLMCGGNGTDASQYNIRVQVFRTDLSKYFDSTGAWSATFAADPTVQFVRMGYIGANAMSSSQLKYASPVLWSDRDMTGTVVLTDLEQFKSPTNPDGPTCLFNKEYFMSNNSGQANIGSLKEIDIWIPLNKLHKFLDEGDTNNLTTAPNFGVNGDYAFVISYFNSSDLVSTGAPQTLTVDAQCTVYWKDP